MLAEQIRGKWWTSFNFLTQLLWRLFNGKKQSGRFYFWWLLSLPTYHTRIHRLRHTHTRRHTQAQMFTRLRRDHDGPIAKRMQNSLNRLECRARFQPVGQKKTLRTIVWTFKKNFFIKLGFNRQSFMEPKGTGTNRAELGLLNWNKTVNTCTKLQKNGFSTINILKSTLVPPEPWLWRH